MANENETPPVISKPFSFQLRNTSIHECDDVRRCLWRHIWRPLLHQDPTGGVVGKTMEHRINWQFQWLWLGKVQKLRISAWIENTRPTLLRQYGMKATIRVQTLHFSNTEIEYAFLNINQYKQKQSNTFYFNLFIPEQRRPKIPMAWQWVAALFGNRHMAKCHQRVPWNLVESESNYGNPWAPKKRFIFHNFHNLSLFLFLFSKKGKCRKLRTEFANKGPRTMADSGSRTVLQQHYFLFGHFSLTCKLKRSARPIMLNTIKIEDLQVIPLGLLDIFTW